MSPHFPALVLMVSVVTSVPVSAQEIITYFVPEESPRGYPLSNLTQRAGLTARYSARELSEIRYTFLSSGASREELFDLDQQTGMLRTAQVIDRDVICPYMRTCDIELDIKLTPPKYFRIIKVRVTLIDINDNAPIFSEDTVVRSLPESSEVGTKLSLPIANDPDGPQFGIVRYALESDYDVFSLQDGSLGLEDLQLVLVAPLDRERTDSYVLHVMAIDGGIPAKTGSVTVKVYVADVNDNSPRFQNQTYDVQVPEDIAITSRILQVHAIDPDDGINGQVVYGFSDRTEAAHGDKFMMDPQTGDILVIGDLDYETEKSFTLFVTARDNLPNSVPAHAKINVIITDLNDHAPEITVKTKLVNGKLPVEEESPNGTFVAHIGVTDPDDGANGNFSCFMDSPYFDLTAMYSTDYKMTTTVSFDRETQDLYSVTVMCVDRGATPQTSSVSLDVSILDINDQAPTFRPSIITVSMEEGNRPGTVVTTVKANDGDLGDNARITYTLVDNANGAFSIDSETGELTANVIMDRERTRSLNVTVRAIDDGKPRLSGLALVIIYITDVDDEVPRFLKPFYLFNVDENLPEGSFVGQVQAEDNDRPPYNQFVYEMDDRNGTSHELFYIDPSTGVIHNAVILDREVTRRHELVILAKSITGMNLVSSVKVTVHVNDMNDNAPEIVSPSQYNSTIYVDPESAFSGQILTTITAIDRDIGVNNICEYAFLQGAPDNMLYLDPANGTLIMRDKQNWYVGQSLDLEIIVYDCGNPRLSATRTITVRYEEEKLDESGHYQRKNLVTVIVISVITVVVAICLIIMILLVVRNRRKLDRKYNWMARMADQRIRDDPILEKTTAVTMDTTGEDNDGLKLVLGAESAPEERTIEGQESGARDSAWEGRRQMVDSYRSVAPEGCSVSHPGPLPSRLVYHTDHTVQKPAVYNPHPEQRPSPAGESESLYSAVDSGRGSAVSDGSSPGRVSAISEPSPPGRGSAGNFPNVGAWNGSQESENLMYNESPSISTWELSPGIHLCDSQRLASTLSRPESSTPRPSSWVENDRPSWLESDHLSWGDNDRSARQPQVRFSLPPEVSSLASTCSQSEECLREKQI